MINNKSGQGNTNSNGPKYKVKINQKEYEFDNQMVSGREILEKAGKTPPETFLLNQIGHGGNSQVVEYNQIIDLSLPGIEKFTVIPKDATDGSKIEPMEMRMQFNLPEEDVNFLDSLGLPWETLKEGHHWLLIHDYPLPEGYKLKSTMIGLRLEGYPTSQIDMAYFWPALQRKDEREIKALAMIPLDGKQFQQWSRHRTANNPWIPGDDNIQTHLDMFNFLLTNELTR